MKNCCVVLRYGSNAIFLGSVEATDVNVSSNITSYPIYSGDTVGEHMIREPITVSLRGSYAVNGSDGILINNDVPSLKRFQQEMEALRDNGTLCDYYKIAYNPSDPRFVKRTGMALKNISWVEHFNSLEFSLSFQQVFVASVASGPSIYAGQSNYSNGSEQMPGSYNPNTGVVTDLPTGQTANTSRAPGEVSYDDFGITEKNDEYIPDFSEPYSSNFIPEHTDKEAIIAAIIAYCMDEGVVDQAFLQYVQDTNLYGKTIGEVGVAIGYVMLCISKSWYAAAAAGSVVGGTIGPVLLGLIGAGILVGGAYLIVRAFLGQLDIAERKRKFKKTVFEVTNDPKKNREAAKRFNEFMEAVYEKLTKFDENFLVYEFPNSEPNQQAVINANGSEVKISTEKTDFGLGIRFKTAADEFFQGDMYAAAKPDFLSHGSECNFIMGTYDEPKYYGYLLFSNMEKYKNSEGITTAEIEQYGKANPQDFIVVIASMTPLDFTNEIANTVCNYIYTNYQDVIGEG